MSQGPSSQAAAPGYLHDLIDIGVLSEMQLGKEKLFIHPKLMQLITGDKNQFQRYT